MLDSILNQRLLDRLRGERRPYTITNQAGDAGKPAQLRIYEEIGIWGVTEAEFARALANITASEIEVQVSSPGGDVFSGIAIYNALRAHPARIVTRVDGLAASIASVIVQAGDERIMLSHAQQMIHDAWGLVVGTAAGMRKTADLLDKQTEVIAGIYAERTRRPIATIRKLMKDETWFTDQEAVDAGLADRIVKPKNQSRGKNSLTPDQRAVLAEAEQHIGQASRQVWREDLERIAAKLQADTDRESIREELLGMQSRDALTQAEEIIERSYHDHRPPEDYAEVPPASIPSAVRSAAAQMLQQASSDLSIPAPPLKWFRPATKGDRVAFSHSPVNGLADRAAGQIWVRCGLTPGNTMSVVAHEVAHIAGHGEHDAREYEDQYSDGKD